MSSNMMELVINSLTANGKNCEKADCPMVVTPLRTITNYFAKYEDIVISGQQNGMYGQGKERREKVEAVIETAGSETGKDTAWEACLLSSVALGCCG